MKGIYIFEVKNASFYCDRINSENDSFVKEYIGFGNAFQNIIMIICSFFGIFINLFFFFSSIKKIINSKKSNNIYLSSIEKILCIISITETFISICWLINSFQMKTTKEQLDYCTTCRVIGFFELFFYVFDWMILSSTLYQIKKMLINPLETLKTEKYIIRYIIFCAFFGAFNVFLGYFAEVEGVSPMLTCFIDIIGWKYEDDEKIIKTIFYTMFFFIPICILLYGIYQIYSIVKMPQFKNNKNNRKFFKSYLLYIFTYIILALLLISVYIFDYIIGRKVPKGIMKIYVNLVTNLSCSTPLIVGVIRLFQTKLIKNIFLFNCNKKRRNNNIDYNKDEKILDSGSRSTSVSEYNFVEFEQDLICKEFKKIFIGISYILGKSKIKEIDEDENGEEKEKEKEKEEGSDLIKINAINNSNNDSGNNIINEFDNDKPNNYIINKKEILKDFDLHINEDIFVLRQDEIDIEAIEYMPNLFKKLRNIDNLKEDEISKYFQPKNVTPDLFKKTNDSNYYINSTNKQFILKSIYLEQIEFYRKQLKKGKIDEYLEQNKDSIINRVYGLYYLKIDDNKNYYIALMENIYESINKNNFDFTESINNRSINGEEKKMYLNENEINERIIVMDDEHNLDMSISRSQRKTLFRKESIFISDKKFKIFLDINEYTRIKRIIQKDIEFLHRTGTNRAQFLVVEKSIDMNIWNNLFSNIVNIQETNRQNKSANIRKYIFKSTKENIIYCISITGYFNNYYE